MTKMDTRDLQYRLLTDANEDYTNLCEAIWETIGDETTTVAEKYAEAEDALRELLNRGWVLLYHTENGEDYKAIPPEELDSVLAHPNSWFPPYPDYWTVFGATEEGRRVWMAGLNPALEVPG